LYQIKEIGIAADITKVCFDLVWRPYWLFQYFFPNGSREARWNVDGQACL